jgi:hypothetical protein
MGCLKRGIRPLRAAPIACRRPYVTITLREAEHWPQRNSNVPAWLEAAEDMEHDVVVIRDTLKSDEPMDRSDPEASKDLHRRAGLYAGSMLNMGINNGPMWMAVAMDTPVVIVIPDLDSPQSGRWRYLRRNGMEPGNPNPWGAKHQRVVWGPDTKETILSAYREWRSADRHATIWT